MSRTQLIMPLLSLSLAGLLGCDATEPSSETPAPPPPSLARGIKPVLSPWRGSVEDGGVWSFLGTTTLTINLPGRQLVTRGCPAPGLCGGIIGSSSFSGAFVHIAVMDEYSRGASRIVFGIATGDASTFEAAIIEDQNAWRAFLQSQSGVSTGAVAANIRSFVSTQANVVRGLTRLSPFIALPPDITSGLRAYYPFSGNAQDASGNGEHGIPASGAVLSADRFGNPASAYSFSGNLGFINIGQVHLTSAFTLSAWIRPDQQLVGGVISKFATGGGQGYELLYAGEQQQHCMRLHTSGLRGTVGFDCGVALALGRWYHVTGTYDGSSVGRLYLDGELAGEFSGLLPDLAGGPATLIGRSAWGAQTFPGAIDEVRIYDRALTPEQVAYLRSVFE